MKPFAPAEDQETILPFVSEIEIEKIVSERSRYKSADYFILSEDKGESFEITDCLSVTQQGYVRYHDFREFVI